MKLKEHQRAIEIMNRINNLKDEVIMLNSVEGNFMSKAYYKLNKTKLRERFSLQVENYTRISALDNSETRKIIDFLIIGRLNKIKDLEKEYDEIGKEKV